jgi:isopenicillin N synthase-like dioxygenase
MSIAAFFTPSLDTVVSPAPELLHRETNAPAFNGIKYQEYMQLQLINQLDGKTCLDRVRILPA